MSNGRRFAGFGLGAAMFAGSLVRARRAKVPDPEERLFRLINGADERIRVPVRTVMQAGTFGTVPAIAAVAWLARRRDLAARLAAGGTAAWLLAKAVKPLAGRARPEAAIGRVTIRERIAGDLGWVSGHAAVSTSMAVVASRELPSWSVPALGAVVATVGFGRMYVGAHLPHDVVGGAGLGLMLGTVVAR